ncbi:hypothetical protein H6F96_10020 [Microcoleus sp. FACHB-53]|nr:hypothetical protein [Microcoleus sp. FACHB-53]
MVKQSLPSLYEAQDEPGNLLLLVMHNPLQEAANRIQIQALPQYRLKHYETALATVVFVVRDCIRTPALADRILSSC